MWQISETTFESQCLSQWKSDFKFRKRIHFTVNINGAMVFLNDTVTDRESQSCALTNFLCRKEWVVNLIYFFVRNSYSVVSKSNLRCLESYVVSIEMCPCIVESSSLLSLMASLELLEQVDQYLF